MVDAAPLADVVRSGFVESVHYGSVVVLDDGGERAVDVGDTDAQIFPRSSNKPMQALGMLRAGMDVDGADLAIAAASHSGEPMHVAQAESLLRQAGLGPDRLICPPDLPSEADARRNAGQPARLYMNCSGKHSGMLLACVRAGWPTEGYQEPDHPLQKVIRSTVEELTGQTVTAVGVDGCGAPIFSASLAGLARAFSRLVTAAPGTLERRVADAMRAHPQLVGGTGRDDTLLMGSVPGLLMKGGAEGVHVAALPSGAAVALKISDGSSRARMPVMTACLRLLGADAQLPAEPVLGGGRPVGEVRVRPGALGA